MWISGYDIVNWTVLVLFFIYFPLEWNTAFTREGSYFTQSRSAHKTVTVEAFPHLSTNWASVHPCKHSAVMKKIIDQYSAAEKEIRVDQYLVIF